LCKIITGLGGKETMIRKLDEAKSKKKRLVSRRSKVGEPKAQSVFSWALFKPSEHPWAAQKQAQAVSL